MSKCISWYQHRDFSAVEWENVVAIWNKIHSNLDKLIAAHKLSQEVNCNFIEDKDYILITKEGLQASYADDFFTVNNLGTEFYVWGYDIPRTQPCVLTKELKPSYDGDEEMEYKCIKTRGEFYQLPMLALLAILNKHHPDVITGVDGELEDLSRWELEVICTISIEYSSSLPLQLDYLALYKQIRGAGSDINIISPKEYKLDHVLERELGIVVGLESSEEQHDQPIIVEPLKFRDADNVMDTSKWVIGVDEASGADYTAISNQADDTFIPYAGNCNSMKEETNE